MDRLWAPWRLAYVAAAKPPAEDDPCFLCAGLAADDDRAHQIALRTAHSVVTLNRYPYSNGHLLVAPKTHKSQLHDLSRDEIVDSQETLSLMVKILSELIKPDGFNVGLNIGRAAGAGLPGHLHWHVVPRWHGDTNFMTVVSDARVIVQSLETLYDLLVDAISDHVV